MEVSTSLAEEDARWRDKERREFKPALRSGNRKKKQTWEEVLALIRSRDEFRLESRPVSGRGFGTFSQTIPLSHVL